MARDIDLGGLDNLVANAERNIRELFKLYQKTELDTRFTKVYTGQVVNPESRSVAIEYYDETHLLRSWIGRAKRNFTVTLFFNIWYYHEQPETPERKREVQELLWRMSQMFQQHTTINGFCNGLGSEVVGTEYSSKRLGTGNKIMAAGLVRLSLRKLHSVTNVD